MKTVWKRMLAVLLALTLCCSCLPVVSLADGSRAAAVQVVEGLRGDGESPLEDASAQLGEYTEPSGENPAEPEAPSEEPEDPASEEPSAEEPEEPSEEEPEEPSEEEPEEPSEEEPEEPSEEEPDEPSEDEPEEDAETDANKPDEDDDGEDEEPAELNAAGDTPPVDGRDYAGQVTMSVGGTDFIFVGSEAQLRALDYYPNYDTNAARDAARYNVMGPIWYVNTNDTTDATLVYPGDADLTGDYAGYQLYGIAGSIQTGDANSSHNGKTIGQTVGNYQYRGKDSGGNWVTSYSYGKYTQVNNYVVFRDVALSNENWTPLMFYGQMYGVNGAGQDAGYVRAGVSAIKNSASAADYASYGQPTISNVSVTTGGEMDATNYVGVGFFASITSDRPTTELTVTRAEVRNIKLEKVNIENGHTGIHVDVSVVNTVTTLLGTGLGWAVDGLLGGLLNKETEFGTALTSLLNARAQDPTNLATGGFAGRIYGEVLVEKCDVDDVKVRGAISYIGGFVGYCDGIVAYEGLSNTLNGLTDFLGDLLNVIPGIGLGDLIGIVTNVLHVGQLIPTDYLNPYVKDCTVSRLGGGTLDPSGTDIGPVNLSQQSWTINAGTTNAVTHDQDCVGGFIGCKIATVMIGCGVQDSKYKVCTKDYGGGFAGLARDADIQTLLSGLGVELGVMKTALEKLMTNKIGIQSMQVRCFIVDADVEVTGVDYLGGFNGGMYNAYCINNQMDRRLHRRLCRHRHPGLGDERGRRSRK